MARIPLQFGPVVSLKNLALPPEAVMSERKELGTRVSEAIHCANREFIRGGVVRRIPREEHNG